MDVLDAIYIIYEIINEYLKKDKIFINEDLWLENMIISFVKKNIDYDLFSTIIFLNKDLDLLIYGNINNDIDKFSIKVNKPRFKMRIRNLSRMIILRLKKLNIELKSS